MSSALEGLRVLDFTSGLSGALAGMVLSDNGAEVIKIEPPGGDPDRALPAFVMWHRGKQSSVLDLKQPAGRDAARQLAGQADVLIENWRPGVAERLGLGYDALDATNPGLIYCAITAFGPKGPNAGLKGYEGVVTAKAGIMAGFAGLAERDGPCYAAVPAASFSASQTALQGILAALYVRAETGLGQKVETSLVQALTPFDLYNWLGEQLAERDQAFRTATVRSSVGLGMMVGWTRDGRWLQFANAQPHQHYALFQALGLAERYRPGVLDEQTAAELEETILRRLSEKTLDEWMEIFLRSDDIGVEPVRTTREGMDHPQALHNGQVVTVDDPRLGTTRQIGPLVAMAKTPARVGRPAPSLGEHQDARFSSPPPTLPPSRSRPEGRAPLDGVTVVDLSWFYAAPMGVTLLGDLGARIIKVEGLQGDPHRFLFGVPEFNGVKAIQGRESIAVDYVAPEGREILHRLVARADVVMRNYRQSNSEATGVDYESLRQANPNIVYLYAGAYGADGPYAPRPAFAPTMATVAGSQARQMGWSKVLTTAGGPIEFAEGKRLSRLLRRASGITGNGDPTAAMGVGTALLLGLVAKQRTGEAQYMQTTMMNTNAYANSDDFIAYAGKPERPLPDAELYGLHALYRLYRAREGWVFLACPRPGEWQVFCAALQRATDGEVSLAGDARFASAESRRAHDGVLAGLLEECFARRKASAWERILTAADVACVEVSSEPFSQFTIASPVVRENGFVAESDHLLFGRHVRHGPTVTLSRTPGVAPPAPLIGQHTRPLLAELGYSEREIQDLKDRAIIGWP